MQALILVVPTVVGVRSCQPDDERPRDPPQTGAVLIPLGIGGIWIGGISVLSVVALVLAVAAIVAVLKNPEFSGGTKTMWILAILVFPILGSLVYFSVRSDW